MNSYQYHDCHHPFQHFHHSHDNYLNISGLNIITWWTISIGMMRHLLVNLCAVLQQKVDHHQVVIQDRLEGKEISKLVDFINSKYFLYIYFIAKEKLYAGSVPIDDYEYFFYVCTVCTRGGISQDETNCRSEVCSLDHLRWTRGPKWTKH